MTPRRRKRIQRRKAHHRKAMPRRPYERLFSIAWLAEQLGCSRQMLYQVLAGEERSQSIEEQLSTMFPELPEWPPRSKKSAPRAEVELEPGMVPLSEWLAGQGRR